MNIYRQIKIIPAIVLFLLPVLQIQAQETDPKTGPDQPEETEIILPKMYLEIEDLTIEEIDAVIPDDDEVMLSSLELPFPEPDQITIPVEAFALTDIDLSGRSTVSAEQQSSSFFSESTIGAGTSSRISGDINLYHIGGQPDFRLKYFHDSYDGFAGADAGEGYSYREELVEAELNYLSDTLEGDLIIGYNEIENGLQGRTDYFSVTRRIPSITGDLSWGFTDLLSLEGALDASAAGWQLNSLDPAEGFNFVELHPALGLSFGNDLNSVGLRFNYGLDGSLSGADLNQSLGGGLYFSAEPADIFKISGNADVFWDNYSEVLFPFRLKISGASAVVEYELSGGYEAYYASYEDLWNVHPAAAGPESSGAMNELPLTKGWTVDGGLRWIINDAVSVRGGAGFSVFENALMPSESSLSGFSYITSVDSTLLDTSAGLYLKIVDGITVSLDWNGQMLGMDWFRPRHSFNSELDMVSEDRDLGVNFGAGFFVYDEQQTWHVNDWLPVMNLEAFLRIAEGFVLSVSAEDFAAVFLESGRNSWNGYFDKGAMLQASIKISL